MIEEDETKVEEEEKDEEKEEEKKYRDYYTRQMNNEDEDDENEYRVSYENRTILASRTVYTYLEIIPTPLIPMIIYGGATYIRRGFSQSIFLEPTQHTEDPDYPEEHVSIYCRIFKGKV